MKKFIVHIEGFKPSVIKADRIVVANGAVHLQVVTNGDTVACYPLEKVRAVICQENLEGKDGSAE